MRKPNDAATAAQRASALRTLDDPRVAGALVDAIAAEIRGDFDLADAGYRALIERFSDEPAWIVERANLLERQGRTDDAINAHLEALTLDTGLARSELDLCRLYNRKSDYAKARQR